MSGIILGWAALVATMIVSIILMKIYLLVREVSNGVMAQASQDFHKSSSSLLAAGNEVPDEIIDLIDRMNRSACSGKGHFELLRLLRAYRKMGDNLSRGGSNFETTLNSMRAPLKDLFNRAVVGWLNYLTHQNVIINAMIALEVRRLELRSGRVGQAPEKKGVAFLKRMDGHAC